MEHSYKHHHRYHHSRRGSCLSWPFRALWQLLTTILAFTGRLAAGVIGFVLLVVGIAISLTVIGAIIGLPLALVGFVLILRAIF